MGNNLKIFRFKTNINCGGCIAAVKPHLDHCEGVSHWDVDLANKDKVLTVSAIGSSQQEIIDVVQRAGFKIEPCAQ